jgi:hypothetical protein
MLALKFGEGQSAFIGEIGEMEVKVLAIHKNWVLLGFTGPHKVLRQCHLEAAEEDELLSAQAFSPTPETLLEMEGVA